MVDLTRPRLARHEPARMHGPEPLGRPGATRAGSMNGRRAAALTLAALALLTGPAPVSAAVRDPGPQAAAVAVAALKTGDGCWERVALPPSARSGRFSQLLRDGKNAWLLGIAAPARGGKPLALRLEGGRWRETSVPWRGVSGLVGGDAEPGAGTWAVGYVRPGVSMRPVSGRWLGGRWLDVRVPDPPGPGAALVDAEVLPSGRVWAVGARLEAGRTRAFALQWRGGRWRRSDPALGARESALTSVASSPDGVVWAVGWRLGDRGLEPLVLHRPANGWEVSRTRGLVDGQAVLTDIAFRSASDVYATGYELPRDGIAHVPLLLRWDGAEWTRLELPWAAATSRVVRSIALGGSDGILLTGASVAVNSGWTRGFLARFRQGDWVDVRRLTVNQYHNSELLDGEYLASGPIVAGGHANLSMAYDCTSEPAEVTEDAPADEVPERHVEERRPSSAEGGPGLHARTPAASGRVRFADVARKVGLYEVTPSWGGVSADFDGDGWPDVFYSRHDVVKPRLMLGGKDGFRQTRAGMFRDRDRHGCATDDVDADGRPDLFCVHGADRGAKMKSNELWLKPGSRKPRQVTADYGAVDPFGRGRTATFFRLDDDPYPELLVTNEPERTDGMPSLNRLYRNDGGTRFLSAPDLGLDRSSGGVCSTAGDIDSDGDDDLLLCTSEPGSGLPTGLRVYRNDGGTLVEATKAVGLQPIADQDVVVADFDGDGRADDVAQLGWSGLRVSIWRGGSFRLVFSARVTAGVALGAGDADGDGRADLYVVRAGSGNAPDLMLLNERAGRRFRSVGIPQARSGAADDVVVLDHDRNGLDDFLVLNGRGRSGPVQLIASYRRR
jgi:hypothetical protein